MSGERPAIAASCLSTLRLALRFHIRKAHRLDFTCERAAVRQLPEGVAVCQLPSRRYEPQTGEASSFPDIASDERHGRQTQPRLVSNVVIVSVGWFTSTSQRRDQVFAPYRTGSFALLRYLSRTPSRNVWRRLNVTTLLPPRAVGGLTSSP